jgi:hypothetical protein
MQCREGLVERLLRDSGTGDRKIHTLAPAGRLRRGGKNACDEQRQHSKNNPMIAHDDYSPLKVITEDQEAYCRWCRGASTSLPSVLRGSSSRVESLEL